MRKLSAVPHKTLYYLPPRSQSPFSSADFVHFCTLSSLTFLSLPRVSQQYEELPLSNAFKFEIQTVHLAASYFVYSIHSLELSMSHRTYIYNIWKNSLFAFFSISSSALIDSSSLIWSTSRKKPESEGNYRVSGMYPILFHTIFYLVSL